MICEEGEFPMKALRDLKANWDSYGAASLDERVIQKAYELWRQLVGHWDVVPGSDGSIQLEQHRDGFDIEVLITSVSEDAGT